MAKGQGVNQELSAILNQLWAADENRLKPGKDYTISLQGKAGYVAPRSNNARDRASLPLFTYVNEERLKSIKTYEMFISLLDNYEMSTGVSETITPEEVAENNRFLDAVLGTKVMKLAHQYLVGKKQARPDPKEFKTQLYDIWFQLYNRDRRSGADSCGFEHVFVGETRCGKEIMGLHNWIQFYLQEKHNNVDYKGYKARDNKDTPDEEDHVLSLQFSWKGLVKPVGSSFIGVSPEFEFAVYTIVFMMSQDKVTSAIVRVDEYQLEVVVCRHGRCIGTSYPKLLSSNNKQ
ncbi:poly(U)-specific endoribonuclease-like [Acipenser oxyrinchus oxyrinchus]|uniref:Uridylate-specific endoribonuclease n=1 Tax=Acipenser oxyrinchus oxyrinchus TaxID=40147 RepID=A0AAD8G879_ACIOX|nr:poly(U)-specific endoribonuclease-like [Acipenser oxyrinchus oxyrinchus]